MGKEIINLKAMEINYSTQVSVKFNNYGINKSKTAIKHSESYGISICLTLFMLFYYYFSLLDADNPSLIIRVIPIALTLFIDLYIIFKLFSVHLISKNEKIFLFAFLFLSVISWLLNSSGIHRLLMFIMAITAVLLFVKQPLNFNEAVRLFWLFAICVVLILFNTARGAIDLVLDHQFNPNTGAFLLTMLFCASFAICAKFKAFSKKLPYIIVCIVSLALQSIYISRTALLGILIFVFLYILCRANKKTFKSKTVFCGILIFSVLGVLLAYIYSEILFPAIGYGKIHIFGKDLFTGRQTIWNFTFDSINANLWFGVGSHLNEEYIEQGYYELIMNAHNQPLGILAACGLLIFIVFYIALSFYLSKLYAHRKSQTESHNRVPIIFMVTVTIMSYFDVYFMSLFNLLPILIIFLIIIGPSKMRKKEIK